MYVASHLGRHWKIIWTSGKETMGTCDRTSKTITLSRPLLAPLKPHDFVELLAHEVAHGLDGSKGEEEHGPTWRGIMRDLGFP